MSLDVTILDARMRDLVLPIARLERLSTDHLWAEGPIWHPTGEFLLWSDIPKNRTYQWVPELGVRVFSYDSRYANGQTMDAEGRRIDALTETFARERDHVVFHASLGSRRYFSALAHVDAVIDRGPAE